MLYSLEKNLQSHRLIKKNDAVVLAVSGGVDSMALLDLFSGLSGSWKLKPVVAHVNHGLRGRRSDADEMLVRRTCEKFKIPFYSVRWKPPLKGNIQDGARRFRYAFFKKVAKEIGAEAVATAHNRDDQAETLLLHLIRGSGVRGMSGMDWSTKGDVKIIRPLLSFGRDQIESYAKKRKIRFAHDASNDKTKYTRNFVRLKVMPELEAINPRVRESLADAAKVLRECNNALEEVSRAFANEFLRVAGRRIVWDREPFMRLPSALRRGVLIFAYEKLKGDRFNLNSDQIGHMESISQGTKLKARYMLPGRIEFCRTNELLELKWPFGYAPPNSIFPVKGER